jgi:hypothetical protein
MEAAVCRVEGVVVVPGDEEGGDEKEGEDWEVWTGILRTRRR